MMENLLYYFETRYILFIVLTVLMLFALIGYFAKKKSDKERPIKLADENALAKQNLENLAQSMDKNISINDLMKKNSDNMHVQPTTQNQVSNVANSQNVPPTNDTLQVTIQSPTDNQINKVDNLL